VAKRSTPGRRSRKRRAGAPARSAAAAAAPAQSDATAAESGADAASGAGADAASGTGADAATATAARDVGRTRPRQQARVRAGGVTDALAVGERPPAPWHPFPLSELLILVGVIGAVIAFSRGAERGTALLIASIACVILGTVEVTLREHLSGYRSHATLLSVLPPLALHSAVVLVTQSQTQVPRWLNVALLPIDGALFAVLFKVLRARFVDARRERTLAGR
jgi:hypothetical protein